MTFQRSTARRIIGAHSCHDAPTSAIVVGGYDPSLAPDEWTDPAIGVDVIVRGEGDVTFREVDSRVRRRHRPLANIDGIWYRDDGIFRRNPPPWRRAPRMTVRSDCPIAPRACCPATR